MSNSADAIVALLALIGLLSFFYGPWQSLCIDLSRQFIFERRNKLFDMALAGRIDFDSEAYRAARRTLNGLIRFAHDMTWPEMAISIYYTYRAKPKFPRWRDTLSDLPSETRKDIEALVRECSVVLVGMMAMRSFFFAPLIVAIGLGVAGTMGLNWLVRCVANQEKFDPINETIQSTSSDFAENEDACAA